MRSLEHRLLDGSYQLSGDEIVPGGQPDQRIRVQDLRTWRQVFLCVGVWDIQIQTTEGRTLNWPDKLGDLLAICQRVAADREKPFVCV